MHKLLKYHGQSATVRNFEKTGEDEYGDPNFNETTSGTRVITDRQDNLIRAPQSEPEQDARSYVYIYLDEAIDIRDGSGDTWPSEIDVGGKTYVVDLVDDEEVGLISQRQGDGLVRVLGDQR